jgi:2-phospho-L-lactate guanylyltransferase
VSESAEHAHWVVVVPVKPARVGKTRLGAGVDLVRAISLDTIEAAARAVRVEVVLVPTSDAGLGTALHGHPKVRVLPEDEPRGIGAAIRHALADVADVALASPRAVLLGDLPALDPADLDAALALAAGVARAFVADEEGTGTSLVTAAAGVELVAEFGTDSASRHRELGLVELPVASGSTLRRDVDTPEQLSAAAALGLGPRSRGLVP